MSDLDGMDAFDRVLERLLDEHAKAASADIRMREMTREKGAVEGDLRTALGQITDLKGHQQHRNRVAKELAETIAAAVPSLPADQRNKLTPLLVGAASCGIYDPEPF